jgi:lipoprotein-releasing system ATP-binding protein
LHEQFTQLVRDLNIAMVVVTHNKALAARADRALLLEDGKLQETDVREVLA